MPREKEELKVYCKNCKYSEMKVVRNLTIWHRINWSLNSLFVGPDLSHVCFHDTTLIILPDGELEQEPNYFRKKSDYNKEGKCPYYKRKWWKFWVR